MPQVSVSPTQVVVTVPAAIPTLYQVVLSTPFGTDDADFTVTA